jgi:hypothetical protein
MTQEQFASLLKFFKVLGNESRLKILGLLATQERNVGELAELLELKEPTVSHHLAMMKEMGLVKVRAEGNVRIYWLDTRFLESMNRDLFSQASLSSLIDEEGIENTWEKKVLQTFLEDGRIKQIPARYKKQVVIINWLADQFEADRRYPEAELNELLKGYHDDYASLRRYLVDHKLMQRDKGVYWRTAQ